MRFVWLLLCLIALPAAAQKTHDYCMACHSEHVSDFQSHPHFAKGLSCDMCHGQSTKHREAAGGAAPDRVAAPDEVPALCGTCHAGQHKEYLVSKHAKLVLSRARVRSANCGTCHGVHYPRTARQVEQRCAQCHSSLPDACRAEPVAKTAKVSCVNCHSQHTLAKK